MNKYIEAVVFDMDGLILDSENLWQKSVVMTNKYDHTNVPLTLINECIGLRNSDIDKKLKEVMGNDFDTDKFRELNRYYMNKEIEENGLKVKEGFFELIDFLKAQRIKVAVASSSSIETIKKRFAASKIDTDIFDFLIGGNMVNNSKPDPEIYLKACELLNVSPELTIALEDSNNGIISAYRAGLKPILIPDIVVNSEYVKSISFKILKNMSEVIGLIKEINN